MSTTQSVLDMMTEGVVGRKDAKAATLTPVGMEKGGPLDGKHATSFPYDDPQTIHNALRHGLSLVAEAKAELDHVGQGLIALAQLYGLSEDQAVASERPDPMAAQREKERAADERVRTVTTPQTEQFIESFAAKSAAAQAATFAPDPAVVSGDAGTAGWACPEHGLDNLVTLTSRRGREYRACQACKQFEKEVQQ